MRKLAALCFLLTAVICSAFAQIDDSDDGFNVTDKTFNPNRALDSLNTSHKEVPKGMYVWSIDSRFGDVIPAERDTVMHLFMNSGFTSGTYGEYNYTGNLGAPRINRIATDRNLIPDFEFTQSYDYFLVQPDDIRFTNTLSPITNLSYYSCGDRTDGEDRLRALFATNINKEAGFGFKFDYLYGRGYYQGQSNSLFDYTMWGSYLGPRYQAHLVFSFDHMKTTENGGISNDDYITHPEIQSQAFNTNEIPVNLANNWNRNNAFHALFTHRYNVGFYRKVPMTESEKEAKRYAMQVRKEQREREMAARLREQGADEEQTKAKPNGKGAFTGRPTDAKVVGALTVDSLNQIKKTISDENKQMVDSLMAAKNDVEEEDTSWLKDEYVPVTSFIHTAKFDNHTRIYTAYSSPSDYYLNRYYVPQERCGGDSINDKTTYWMLNNTFAIGLLEGFNKYVPMGAKVFLSHQLTHYTLPSAQLLEDNTKVYKAGWESYNEHNITAGAQLIKSEGNALHYNATGEVYLVGEDAGDVYLDGTADLNLKFSARDSLRLDMAAFYHLTNPLTYQSVYHSKHFSWDNDDFGKQMHTHLEGTLTLPRTKTSLRVCYDNLQNYTYLGMSYNRTGERITGYTAAMRQASSNISLLTASLGQDFALGPLRWENRLTFQKCSDKDVLPVPTFNVWSNLYLDFKIAKVLNVHFGADARYFSSYYAPEYCPQLGQYAVQENKDVRTKVGNYPVVDVYANFTLKKCRFFIMYSHVNAGSGNLNYFFVPHHPLNERVMRFGLSWDFFN